MASLDLAPEVTVWTDRPRANLARQVLDLMGSAIGVVAVGGPRGGEIDRLAADFEVARDDDLRQQLVDHPAAFVLLLGDDGIDPMVVGDAYTSGSTVLSTEPIHWDLEQVTDGPACTTLLVPSFDRSPGWTSSADPHEVLAVPHLIRLSSYGSPKLCSLFACLFDAWQLVLQIAGPPETIDASLSGGPVPVDLRAMVGHLAVHARIGGGPNGCSTLLEVSNLSGRSGRQLSVVGAQATLLVDDRSYELRNSDHVMIDHWDSASTLLSPADQIAQQWQRMLGRPRASQRRGLEAARLACCQATLLSARTGQSESPLKLLQAHRIG